jgi:DNA-binding NarL/FixJ family response regulator
VVVVDPAHTVRAGLAMLIGTQPDMEVLGQGAGADDGLQTVSRLRRRSRIVVLVSLAIGGEHDAFWLIRAIRERCPTHTIVASGAGTERTRISRALFVGADGYVDKNYEPEQFLDALRHAVDGEVVLSGVPGNWLGEIAESLERQRDANPILTERELEVLSVAAEGLTARQIGHRLGVRERTITTHLGRIYSKLGVGGRVGAVRAAARVGLVTVNSQE